MWDFVACVGREVSLEGMFARALQELSALLPFESAFANLVDYSALFPQGRFSLLSMGLGKRAEERYLNRYVFMHPARLAWTPGVPFLQTDRRERAYRSTEFVSDFVKPLLRIDMSAGIPMRSSDGRGAAVLGITRTRSSSLSPREQAILLALQPHIENLFSMHRKTEAVTPPSIHDAELARGNGLLSRRESEIAGLLCRRLSAPEIATLLLVSPRTVERHVEHIYQKLNVRNRRELLVLLLVGDGRAPAARRLPA